MTFLLVAVVVIVTPGPDFALTVRNAALRRAGLATAAGVVTGQACWALATAAGLAAVLLASQQMFAVLRVMGAAYLVYLGLSTLVGLWRRTSHTPRRFGVRSPYAQGLLSNLSNPKMPVFFTSLLPQFGSTFGALAWHGLAFAALTLAWLTLVAHVGAALSRGRVRRALDAVTGIALTLLGIELATRRTAIF
jgi:threonine/homoserine/homoserine lactone efflux protein